MAPPSVLMLELNELAPRVMEQLIAEGELPNFERLRGESTVAITDPEEEQSGLEPWIQWVTVHTGVSREEHGIEKLGEAHRLDQVTVGEVVGATGRKVLICGSMNLPRRAAGGGTHLPDPWNPDTVPSPPSLAAFSDFVRANVQEHSNASAGLSPGALARFGWHQLRHGLRPVTVRDAAVQVLRERRGQRGRWARASVLDRLQWDVFRWYWRRERPAFGTFFSNSTAHYQHVYWRNFEPERFTKAPTPEEQKQFGDAVHHGYRQMDRLVGEAMDLVDETGATLMFCTALSQQPYTKADDSGGKYIYRPRSFADVVDGLGIEGVQDVAPVMAEQFHLFFADEQTAAEAVKVLAGCTIDGRPTFGLRVVGNDVFTGCAVHDVVSEDAEMRTHDGRTARFYDLFYRSDTPKSGFHQPDGMWWIRTGHHHVIDEPVSLRRVAPTVLALLGLEPPQTMKADPVDLGAALA